MAILTSFNVTALPYNLSENSSTAVINDHKTDMFLNYFAVTVSMIVLIVGLLGNILVLIVFGMRYKNLNSCEIFMISLAVSDLIGAIVLPVNSIAQLLEYSFNPIGDFGCKVIAFFSMTSVSVSAITLVIISIDRYIVVKWPLKERIPFLTVCLIISFSWILGSILGSVYLFGDRIKIYEAFGHCRDYGSLIEKRRHIFAAMTVQIFIPIVVLALVLANSKYLGNTRLLIYREVVCVNFSPVH